MAYYLYICIKFVLSTGSYLVTDSIYFTVGKMVVKLAR